MTLLSSIHGQDIAKKIICNSFNSNRLASTYLFYGIDGLGKWSMAVAIAVLVNCENPTTDDSGQVVDVCGKCSNCRQIFNLSFPEFHFAVPITPHKSETEANDLIMEYLEQKKTGAIQNYFFASSDDNTDKYCQSNKKKNGD